MYKRKTLTILIFLAIFIVFPFTFNVEAESSTNLVEVSLSTNKGFTEYEINGEDINGQFRSLLEFPLDVELININYEKKLEQDIFNIKMIKLSLSKNINENAGTFKDSDWIESTGIHIKDLIGTSPTKVKDLSQWNIMLQSQWEEIYNDTYYSLHLGYRYDFYQLLSYNLTQTSLTNNFWAPEGTSIYIEGNNIEYEAIYNIPYLGINFKYDKITKLLIEGSISYSPISKIRDRDHHIHRNLVVKGEGEGHTYILKSKISYMLADNWGINIKLNYDYSELEGTQDQYHTAGVVEGINYKARQKNTSFKIGINKKF